MESKITISSESYRRILKSTSILGGSAAFNIVLRLVRTKILAILLGPSGIGLLGLYTSLKDIAVAIARMGIDNSGVRQIAEAVGTGDEEKIACTVYGLRRCSWCLGLFGMSLFILLSSPLGRLTFETSAYTSDLIFLSVVVFLEIIMAGEIARIQGMRKIGDLAKVYAFSALYSTFLCIPILFTWGQNGIILFLIATAVAGALTAWWYARKIEGCCVQMSWMEIWANVKPLLSLGSVFMLGDWMSKGTIYLVRIFVIRWLGLEAVGFYQASIALSSIYVAFILDSMIKDYYPRLTALASDNKAFNELVNQQSEVGILLSAPGILATLTFAPIILQIFYTAKFMAAFEILRWQILGVFIQVACWPMSFILQAKGRGRLFLFTELLKNAIHIGLMWAGIYYFALKGAGIAFFGMYFLYCVIIYTTAKYLTGFSLSKANIKNIMLVIPAIGIVFVSDLFLEEGWYLILGSTVSVAIGLYSMKNLASSIGLGKFESVLVRIRKRLYDRVS